MQHAQVGLPAAQLYSGIEAFILFFVIFVSFFMIFFDFLFGWRGYYTHEVHLPVLPLSFLVFSGSSLP